MESNIKLSLIIPVYNEEKNLPSSLPKLVKWLDDGKGTRELIMYDDGSTDRSAEMIEECAKEAAGLKLIKAERNQGKGASVRAGMLAATGRYRVFTDCDLAYGLDSVRRIEARLTDSNADVVIGSRALHPKGYEGYSSFRRVVSKAYIKILRTAAGLSQTDSQCGLKGFTADAAEKIFPLCASNGFAFDLEVLTVAKQLGMRVAEIPVSIVNHSQQDSKVRPARDAIKMLREVRKIKKKHSHLNIDTAPKQTENSDTAQNQN